MTIKKQLFSCIHRCLLWFLCARPYRVSWLVEPTTAWLGLVCSAWPYRISWLVVPTTAWLGLVCMAVQNLLTYLLGQHKLDLKVKMKTIKKEKKNLTNFCTSCNLNYHVKGSWWLIIFFRGFLFILFSLPFKKTSFYRIVWTPTVTVF